MKLKLKIGLAVLAVVALIAGFAGVAISNDPIRQSDTDVRQWLLSKTPTGSHFSDVSSFLEHNGWHDERYQQRIPAPAAQPFLGGEIGNYQGIPWHTSVRAFWEFDDDGRLLDIQIERIKDSP